MQRTLVGTGQSAFGALLLLAPARAGSVAAGSGRRPPDWVVRALGARMAAQGLVIAARRSARACRGGSVLDVLHGASMVAAGVLVPVYRRSALLSAAVAFGSAFVAEEAARDRT